MGKLELVDTENPDESLAAIDRSIDLVFDRAPVMMHSADREGRLIKVNRIWLQRLGYTRDEVLGRKNVEFLTEDCRTWSVNDVLPHFWRTGSGHSVGVHFVKRDGEILDLLVDAEVVQNGTGPSFAYAALREGHGVTQWRKAPDAMRALRQLTNMRQRLERVSAHDESAVAQRESAEVENQPTAQIEALSPNETLGCLVELGQDISLNLRGLLRMQEEWRSTTAEHQREMLLIARSIDRCLRDLADAAPDRPANPQAPDHDTM